MPNPGKRKTNGKANVETASHVKAAQTRRAAERLLELGEAAEDEPMLDAAGAPARRHSRSFTPMWSQLYVCWFHGRLFCPHFHPHCLNLHGAGGR